MIYNSQYLCFFLRSEEPKEQCAVETVTIADTDGEVLSSECNSNTEDSQLEGNTSRNLELMVYIFITNLMKTYFVSLPPPIFFPDCIILEEGGSAGASDVVEALEESRATEVSAVFLWDGQIIDKIMWSLKNYITAATIIFMIDYSDSYFHD